MINEGIPHCCGHHARGLGSKLPMSNHAPTCPNYVTEKFKAVRVKGLAGFCVMELNEEPDPPDGSYEYEIEIIEMTRDQFESLSEFTGV